MYSLSKCKTFHNYESEFDLREIECAPAMKHKNFHMNGFALRLIFTQRHKATQKWPIE